MTLMTDEQARTGANIPQRVHLIGIGGAHMSAIARILLARGYDVSGSDLRASPTLDELSRAGARVWIGGHDASHVRNAELVVATAAATSANPEIVAAQELGLTVLSRAQMVARLIAGKRTLAVAGTHGKTTTTSLAIAVVREAGLDPTFLVGGDVVGLETNAAHGDGPIAIIEADEYAHAFLEYAPEIAIVTNVEPDHIDYFGSFDEIRRAFHDFPTRVQRDGRAIVCADSPHLLEIMEDLRRTGEPGTTFETYTLGRERQAEWRAVDIERDEDGQSFTVERAGEAFLRARITLPGRHAVANALAVVAATHALGIDSASIERGLLAARGAHRRFDRHGQVCGIAVYDDYAHHPTEIRATLHAARE
ncbi:MAG TPA: UDP-N-acetylmuramate--L-alanine ligase, partial [Dehalococcoidia bacterium]|nr:UDP-N-acetylmuramate--L-alanine ligase [Dehalococcoidia bacterium]